MKNGNPITMELVEWSGHKLLVGRLGSQIPRGSFVVFHRQGDDYRLQVIEQAGDGSDPETLAAFLPPEIVDANEMIHAAAIAAGIRKKPKPEEVIVRSFGKMEPSDRITVMRTLLDALSDDERRQVMQG